MEEMQNELWKCITYLAHLTESKHTLEPEIAFITITVLAKTQEIPLYAVMFHVAVTNVAKGAGQMWVYFLSSQFFFSTFIPYQVLQEFTQDVCSITC